MQLSIGPFRYDVRLIAGYIDHEGQRCLGLCDNGRQQLLISDQTPRDQQIQVLCHEYMEAWVYHFAGEQPTKEDYCDLMGLAMTQLVTQFTGHATENATHDSAAHDDPADPLQDALQSLRRAIETTRANRAEDTIDATPEAETAKAGHEPLPDQPPLALPREQIVPARPGVSRPWHLRIYDPADLPSDP